MFYLDLFFMVCWGAGVIVVFLLVDRVGVIGAVSSSVVRLIAYCC